MYRSEVQAVQAAGLRQLVPDRWWEKAAAVYQSTFKPDRGHPDVFSLDPKKAAEQLAEIRAQGFQAIEIFAPAEGLYAYAGLDMTDPYRIDSELGTMEDFRRFVRLAHCNGLAVVVFFNVGYFSLEAPAWLEACRDKKAGRDTEKVRWFTWADSPDAPPPALPPDRFFAAGDLIPEGGPDAPKTWGWQYSDLAGCYYWARWEATDKDGKMVGLPQTDWGSPDWPQEAERIIRCWMDTGLDGMIIDAPGCYTRLTTETNNSHITGVIAGYGNTFIQPEGSINMAWLTKAGYNCLQDYALYWGGTWEDSALIAAIRSGDAKRAAGFIGRGPENSVTAAIRTGDPRPIEEALKAYRDQAVSAGGVLYTWAGGRRSQDPQARMLHLATLAGIGDILVYGRRNRPDQEEQWLLLTRYAHPALHPLGSRRQLPTNADNKYYAFLRTAQDGSERVLVVLNFQGSPSTVEVDLSGVATAGVIDLKTAERFDRTLALSVALPAYGYAFFQVLPGP